MREVKRLGPYKGRHGHLFHCLYFEDGSRKSVFVHRERMEKKLGRKLRHNEVVHHKDGDPTNNRLRNLRLTTWSEHAKHHAPEPNLVELVCIECGRAFARKARHEKHNRKQGKKGPYCGKRCASRAQVKRQGRIRGYKGP